MAGIFSELHKICLAHNAFYRMLTSLTLQLWWTSMLFFCMDGGQETFTSLVESSI